MYYCLLILLQYLLLIIITNSVIIRFSLTAHYMMLQLFSFLTSSIDTLNILTSDIIINLLLTVMAITIRISRVIIISDGCFIGRHCHRFRTKQCSFLNGRVVLLFLHSKHIILPCRWKLITFLSGVVLLLITNIRVLLQHILLLLLL